MALEQKTLEGAAQIYYERCRNRLIDFTQFTFPKYQVSKHHRTIASALERLESGEITRLILNVPPQHGKSELATVRLIPWWLGRNPDDPIIAISYGSEPVERFSRDAREVMRSLEYKQIFPDVELDTSSQAVSNWKIKGRQGSLRATSIGGACTSFPCRLLIVDDPHKSVQAAESEAERQNVLDFYTSVAYTRLAPDGRVILIQTRWTDNDLTGTLIERQNHGGDVWEVITLPAVSNIVLETLDNGVQQIIGGEPLWTGRWSLDAYNRVKLNIGSRDWNAQYMCNPTPPDGSLFKRSWFTISPRAPEGLRWVRAWDLATTEKESGSYTAGARMASDITKTIWIDEFTRGQWEYPEARRRIMRQANADGANVEVLIEKGAFQFGKLAKDLVDNWEDIRIPVRAVPVKGLGDKPARARPWAARAEAGRVVLVGTPDTPWIKEFLDEASSFPFGKTTDMIDAVSLGFEILASEATGDLYEKIPPSPNSWEYLCKIGGYDEEDDLDI